jgi:hypothetical protein
VLVCAIASPDGSSQQSSVHHWRQGSRETSFVIPTTVIPEDMRHIVGFHDLGTFAIPGSRSTSTDERHSYLSSLTEATDTPGQQGIECDRAIIRNIVAGLKTEEPVSASLERADLKLSSIEIVTRAEDGLSASDEDEMVWNWVKPGSLYLTKGSWYRTLNEAVVDGVWRAGMGFLIAVEVVGKERKSHMFEQSLG